MKLEDVPKGKSIFTPALGEQVNAECFARNLHKGKDLRWFDKNTSFFYYPYNLQSSYYGNMAAWDWRKDIGYGDDAFLIGDSGGFQKATFQLAGKTFNSNTHRILKWLEHNCDVVMNLDYPPNLTGKNNMPEFKEALRKSLCNFQYFQDNRENYTCSFYNILHGEEKEYADVWYEAVKDFKFDGWAIGMKPPFDPVVQVLGYLYLKSKGELDKPSCKGIHFFGTSGARVIPLFVLISRIEKHLVVTYDSSSYNIGSIYRTYLTKEDLTTSVNLGYKHSIENPDFKELICQCPVCKNIDNVEWLVKCEKRIGGSLISLHNAIKYIEFNEKINKLSELEIEKILSERGKLAKQILDYGLVNGYEKTYIKFMQKDIKLFNFGIEKIENKIKISIPKPETSKQLNLFERKKVFVERVAKQEIKEFVFCNCCKHEFEKQEKYLNPCFDETKQLTILNPIRYFDFQNKCIYCNSSDIEIKQKEVLVCI